MVYLINLHHSILKSVVPVQVTVNDILQLYIRVIIPPMASAQFSNNSNSSYPIRVAVVCPSYIMEDGQDLAGTLHYHLKEEVWETNHYQMKNTNSVQRPIKLQL
jgi:hypothetical protein